MRTVHVTVTEDTIQKAIEAHKVDDRVSKSCVIYQALKDAKVFGDRKFGVGYRTVDVEGDAKTYLILPDEAVAVTGLLSSQWREVKPFSFDVEVIEEDK